MESKKQFQVTEQQYASLGQRFANYLIDTMMQTIFMFIIFVFIVAALKNGSEAFMANFLTNALAQYTLVGFVVLFYYNVFEIFTARTIGKYITLTVVVDVNGEKPHTEAILIRSLCRLIPLEWVYYMFLYFMKLPARGLHDIISKTYVVDKVKLEAYKREFYNLQGTATKQ